MLINSINKKNMQTVKTWMKIIEIQVKKINLHYMIKSSFLSNQLLNMENVGSESTVHVKLKMKLSLINLTILFIYLFIYLFKR